MRVTGKRCPLHERGGLVLNAFGECPLCGGTTADVVYDICRKCSEEKNLCERCSVDLNSTAFSEEALAFWQPVLDDHRKQVTRYYDELSRHQQLLSRLRRRSPDDDELKELIDTYVGRKRGTQDPET